MRRPITLPLLLATACGTSSAAASREPPAHAEVPAASSFRARQPATPAPPSAPPAEACDPNYSPCVPIDSDVDCRGGRGNGPSYVDGPVRVEGADVYGLDRNHDGTGCEP